MFLETDRNNSSEFGYSREIKAVSLQSKKKFVSLPKLLEHNKKLEEKLSSSLEKNLINIANNTSYSSFKFNTNEDLNFLNSWNNSNKKSLLESDAPERFIEEFNYNNNNNLQYNNNNYRDNYGTYIVFLNIFYFTSTKKKFFYI